MANPATSAGAGVALGVSGPSTKLAPADERGVDVARATGLKRRERWIGGVQSRLRGRGGRLVRINRAREGVFEGKFDIASNTTTGGGGAGQTDKGEFVGTEAMCGCV